jgi:hypothetical protein
MLEYTNEFEKRFRMSRSMFDDLVEELRAPLTVLFVKSMNSSSGNEPIYPEVIVAISHGSGGMIMGRIVNTR